MAAEGSIKMKRSNILKACRTCKILTRIECMNCNKHFCNNMTGKKYSHILEHLTECTHNEIRIIDPLSCAKCKTKNIFDLGFFVNYLPKYEDKATPVIYTAMDKKSCVEIVNSDFLCDLICRSCSGYKNYTSMIYNGKLIDALISSFLLKNIKIIKNKKIKSKNKPNLPNVKNIYKPNEYYKINSKLLEYEHKQINERERQFTMENVKTKLIAKKTRMRNSTSEKDYIEIISQYLCICCDKSMQSIKNGGYVDLISNKTKIHGFVMDSTKSNKTKIKIIQVEGKLKNGEVYKLEYKPCCISLKRMMMGLKNLNKIDKELIKHIYGKELTNHHKINKDLDTTKILSEIPNLPTLNDSQLHAIKYAMEKKLVLIQGPPGTGKTLTAAAIVYNLIRMKISNKILVVANSNIAVNNVTEKLHLAGLNVIRVVSDARRNFVDDLTFLTSHYQAKQAYLQEILKGEKKSKDNIAGKISRNKLFQFEKNVINDADVIATTTVTSGKEIFSGCKFPVVVVDEASQCSEPANLIPLIHGCKKLILIGDHKQLGPYILDDNLEAAGFGQTLFQRFIELNYKSVLLNTQYRMHPNCAYLPSSLFYNKKLKNGITGKDRANKFNIPFPNFFYVCFGREEFYGNGMSYVNQMEAEYCYNVVKLLIDVGVKENNIGIITPYEGQRNLLLYKLSSLNTDLLEIKNVDGYQGREKDYIILSTVRSNPKGLIGFLNNERRINVGLTRAKFGLVVLGNPITLSKDKTWKKIIKFYSDRNIMFFGDVKSLAPYKLEIK